MDAVTPVGDDGAASIDSRASTETFLDAGACLELLGNLYPLSASMLFFQLESFLRRAESDYPGPVGQVPRRLLEHNRSGTRHGMELLPVDVDVVAIYDAAAQTTSFEFKDHFEHPGLYRPPGCHRSVLRIKLNGDDKICRVVNVPLQVLMVGWGDVQVGFQGYTHSVTFLSPEGESLEQWLYVGIASRNWLHRMDEHEREIRSGSNRRFLSAWREYTGKAEVVLSSELDLVNQTEDDILSWEETEVDKCLVAGNCLNLVPGGLKGMQHLHKLGVIHSERVPIEERDAAVSGWAHLPDATPNVARVPHFLGVLWQEEGFYLKFLAARSDTLTPAQVIEVRRLAGDGQDPEVIAAAVGARNVEHVRQVLEKWSATRVPNPKL
jgi:hypothetical protein